MQEGKGGGAEKGGSRAALAAETGGIGAAAVEKVGREASEAEAAKGCMQWLLWRHAYHGVNPPY